MYTYFYSPDNDACKMHKSTDSVKMLYIEQFTGCSVTFLPCGGHLHGICWEQNPDLWEPGPDLSLWTHSICQLDLSYLPISWAMKSGGEIFEKVFPERALSLIKEIDYPDLKFFFHLHGMWDTGEGFSEVPAENCEFKEWFLAWVWGKVWAPFP